MITSASSHACSGVDDPQALASAARSRLRRALRQPDPDVDAGVAQGQRVRVALAAVAEHRDVAPLDDRQVGVVVVVDLCHRSPLLFCEFAYRAGWLPGPGLAY